MNHTDKFFIVPILTRNVLKPYCGGGGVLKTRHFPCNHQSNLHSNNSFSCLSNADAISIRISGKGSVLALYRSRTLNVKLNPVWRKQPQTGDKKQNGGHRSVSVWAFLNTPKLDACRRAITCVKPLNLFYSFLEIKPRIKPLNVMWMLIYMHNEPRKWTHGTTNAAICISSPTVP